MRLFYPKLEAEGESDRFPSADGSNSLHSQKTSTSASPCYLIIMVRRLRLVQMYPECIAVGELAVCCSPQIYKINRYVAV